MLSDLLAASVEPLLDSHVYLLLLFLSWVCVVYEMVDYVGPFCLSFWGVFFLHEKKKTSQINKIF